MTAQHNRTITCRSKLPFKKQFQNSHDFQLFITSSAVKYSATSVISLHTSFHTAFSTLSIVIIQCENGIVLNYIQPITQHTTCKWSMQTNICCTITNANTTVRTPNYMKLVYKNQCSQIMSTSTYNTHHSGTDN